MDIKSIQVSVQLTIVQKVDSTIPSRMVTADLTPITVESRKEWFAQHDPTKRPLWVFTSSKSEIVGWLSFENFHQRTAYEKTAELSIYVDEKYRGQGLGSLLLTEAIQSAPNVNIENVVGLIFGHNTPSLKLFQRYGFEQWGYLPRVAELDGVKRNLVIIGKDINE